MPEDKTEPDAKLLIEQLARELAMMRETLMKRLDRFENEIRHELRAIRDRLDDLEQKPA